MLPHGNNANTYNNLSTYLSCLKIFVSPCVLLFYPIWIVPVTLGLGVYGGFSQISWYCANWRKELMDPEKGSSGVTVITYIHCNVPGFFGWLCNKVNLADCCPYQVIILTSLPETDLRTSAI